MQSPGSQVLGLKYRGGGVWASDENPCDRWSRFDSGGATRVLTELAFWRQTIAAKSGSSWSNISISTADCPLWRRTQSLSMTGVSAENSHVPVACRTDSFLMLRLIVSFR